MVVWKVPVLKIDEVGNKLAAFPQVSHCYRRPIYPVWEFNLFSMIHARTIEAEEKIALQISANTINDNSRAIASLINLGLPKEIAISPNAKIIYTDLI
ncbi:MAG: hypothetical protein WA667_30280 [Candidatus Nitrosopolaris sp.]